MRDLLQRIYDWYITEIKEPLREKRISELDNASGYYKGVSHFLPSDEKARDAMRRRFDKVVKGYE